MTTTQTTAAALTGEQIAFFKTQGYVILPNLVGQEWLEHWRGLFWKEVGGSIEDFSASVKGAYVPGGPDGLPAGPGGALHPPQVLSIIEQIGGGNFHRQIGPKPYVIWPSPNQPWSAPVPHVDAFWADKPPAPFMMGVVINLYDILPQGGGFTVYPGSHRRLWDYLAANPALADGGFIRELNNDMSRFYAGVAPVECAGTAGTTMLWNPLMFHAGSINTRATPRIAIISRWFHRHENQLKPAGQGDLFQHWAV